MGHDIHLIFDKFCSNYWSDFLDNSFNEPVTFQAATKNTATAIIEFEEYEMWTYKSRTLRELLPFAKKFFDTFEGMKKEEQKVA